MKATVALPVAVGLTAARRIRYTLPCHSRVVRRGGVGDYSGGDTPVPIPNTVVKPSSPNDTAGAALWDNRTLPIPPRTTLSLNRPGAIRFGPFAGLQPGNAGTRTTEVAGTGTRL